MSTNTCTLEVGSIKAVVIRKAIKNLHLSVLPPNGKVRVSAPLRMNDDSIRTLLATRLSWIKKQQKKFDGQERQTKREYVSGESHYLWGKKYKLEVNYDNQRSSVSLNGKDKMILNLRPKSDRNKREKVMADWYRNELRNVASASVERWTNTMGVKLNSWGIKKMKTRWGTCNQKAGRIWLNLELAKKPEHCLDFIIVHELTHFLEKTHNDIFKAHMDKFFPRWRQAKEELNQSLLCYEKWGC